MIQGFAKFLYIPYVKHSHMCVVVLRCMSSAATVHNDSVRILYVVHVGIALFTFVPRNLNCIVCTFAKV